MAGAQWKHLLTHPDLQRSSHVTTVVGHKLYIFGGELLPRKPRDDKTFCVDLAAAEPIVKAHSTSEAPSPRVGTASTTCNGNIYLFSGRGGTAMTAIDEDGGLWQFDPTNTKWTFVPRVDLSESYPQARSYHCMTSDGVSNIFLHAGCPSSGRLSDLWSFDVASRTWTQLPDAPAPARGGTSIAYHDGKLYRMNGFDGTAEQGSTIDVFDVSQKSWSTKKFEADGVHGPEARSVAAFLPLTLKDRAMLVTLLGEHDPSSLGHAGAGKMLGDWWLYDIAADSWTRGESTVGGQEPAPRGWFDADVVDSNKIVVTGGLSETNERLGDVWVLLFE